RLRQDRVAVLPERVRSGPRERTVGLPYGLECRREGRGPIAPPDRHSPAPRPESVDILCRRGPHCISTATRHAVCWNGSVRWMLLLIAALLAGGIWSLTVIR